MVNRVRGEVELPAGGRRYRLCLTLGALAEIETGLAAETMAGLEQRLGAPRARDLIVVLGALLRGGGHDISDIEVTALPLDVPQAVAAIAACFAAAGLGARPPTPEQEPAR